MTDKTIKQRQARLKARNKAKGLVQVKVWVPECMREPLQEKAAQWRDDYSKGGIVYNPWSPKE